jgi:hypothetical protein
MRARANSQAVLSLHASGNATIIVITSFMIPLCRKRLSAEPGKTVRCVLVEAFTGGLRYMHRCPYQARPAGWADYRECIKALEEKTGLRFDEVET